MKRLFDGVPADAEAEERAWAVVGAAFAAHEPRRRNPWRRGFVVPVAVVVAAAFVAAAVSPPGRAVVNAVRRSIGIEGAQPALFELPAPGRLLVSGAGGTWVVSSDGSTRRLGSFSQASWSPHALYVVAASTDELAAIEPATGRVHWQLARPGISFPRWGGSRTDTRIAYLTSNDLHVIAGDGTGDMRLPPSARVAPVWEPETNGHVLAYVDARGRVTLLAPDHGVVSRRSRAYPGARALAWSPDGKTLALAAHGEVVLFTVATGRTRTVRVGDVRGLAFAPDGRLALLRGDGVMMLSGGRLRTLFVAPGRLAGIAWSPDGRWLLSSLPKADQWVFVQTRGARRVLAVSHIRRQFGGEPSLDGWMR
ncbi:MAG: WD40 repeat domain-containing protein [Gaiellaceae bacterium]